MPALNTWKHLRNTTTLDRESRAWGSILKEGLKHRHVREYLPEAGRMEQRFIKLEETPIAEILPVILPICTGSTLKKKKKNEYIELFK